MEKQSISPQLYEAKLNQLFGELKVPSICRDLIRAFITASEYQTEFEVSRRELAQILFKDACDKENAEARTKYRIKRLLSWQMESRVELVRQLELGHQIEDGNGKKIYVKSKYQFILLAEPVKALLEDDGEKLEKAVLAATELGKLGCEVAEAPKTPIRNQIRRDKRNIITKIRKIYMQAKAIGINAQDYCRQTIIAAECELQRLDEVWEEKESRQRRIEQVNNLIARNQEIQLEADTF